MDHALALQQDLHRTQVELSAIRDAHRAAQEKEQATLSQLHALRAAEQETRSQLVVASQNLATTQQERDDARKILGKVIASRSWQITKPLRALDATP